MLIGLLLILTILVALSCLDHNASCSNYIILPNNTMINTFIFCHVCPCGWISQVKLYQMKLLTKSLLLTKSNAKRDYF